MRRLIAMAGLTVALLGTLAAPARGAEPIGPLCLGLDAFRDSFEFYLTPAGGPNFLLSGRERAEGGPAFGSGYVRQGEFAFYFVTTALNTPGIVFEGSLTLATALGTARCFVIDGELPCRSNILIGLVPCGR